MPKRSLEALLSRYLQSLDDGPLCERLGVLSLVSAGSSGLARLLRLPGKGQKRKAGMMQAEEPQKPDSDQPVDFACGEKAVRLMQKAIQKRGRTTRPSAGKRWTTKRSRPSCAWSCAEPLLRSPRHGVWVMDAMARCQHPLHATTSRRWPPTCNPGFAKSCLAAWIEWT